MTKMVIRVGDVASYGRIGKEGEIAQFLRVNGIVYSIDSHKNVVGFAPSSSGNLVVDNPKTYGIQVDLDNPVYPWHDMLGAIGIRGVGAADPSYNVYQGGIRGYQFDPNEEVFIEFHVLHDYLPTSDLYIHSHWSLNGKTAAGPTAGTVTGGNVIWGFEVSYAKGHNQAAFSTPITTYVTQGASLTTFQHMIAEVALSSSTPSASQLDSADIEVDGVILVRCFLSENNITVASGQLPDPFLHFCDMHYQSTGVGTKNKSPDFWT